MKRNNNMLQDRLAALAIKKYNFEICKNQKQSSNKNRLLFLKIYLPPQIP